jgi:hypothetical protein
MPSENPLFATHRTGRTSTKEELAATEQKIGPLPASYRDFASRYGAGLTNGLILIFMPFPSPVGELVDEHEMETERLQNMLASYLEDGAELGGIDCLEPYDEQSRHVAARYRELVFFARSENGERFAWLATDDGDQFFCIDRACFSVRYCGTDLAEMIRAMQTEAVQSMLGAGYQPLASTFDCVAAA